MSRRAVVFYEIDATDQEKIRALKEGIQECAAELAELGCPLDEIERICMDAVSWAELG